MTKEKEQFSNRRWLKDILHRPLHEATGIICESLTSSLTDKNLLSREMFFKLSNITLELEQTQFYYNDSLIKKKSLDYLSSFIKKNSLVIGYELSEQTRNIFNKIGVTYIDIWLHPVRFYDDIVFAFNSNNHSIRKALFGYNLDENNFYYSADRLKVQSYKGWRRVEPKLSVNSALFIGQMMNDKSVCKDGNYLSLLDFKEEFKKKTKEYSTVYYSRHPYIKTEDKNVLEFVKKFKNVEIIDEAPYRLFASLRLKHVFSLSSSAATEAKYFGKSTSLLYKSVINYGDFNNNNSYSTIFQKFIEPSFWSNVLKNICDVNNVPTYNFIPAKDKIRDMLGFYWSYYDIDKLEHLRTKKKK